MNFLVLIKRLKEPTRKELEDYLSGKARELEGAASLIVPSHLEPKRSPLESEILSLNEKIVRGIREKEPRLMNWLWENSPKSIFNDDTTPVHFMVFKYGWVPPGILDRINSHAEDASWYDDMLSQPELKENGIGARI